MILSRLTKFSRPAWTALLLLSLCGLSYPGRAAAQKAPAPSPSPSPPPDPDSAPARRPLGPRDARLILDAASGTVLLREGACGVRHSPCSTFKLPLAVMGFDDGILKSAHSPVWPYEASSHTSSRPEEKTDIDPSSWQKLSVVWYSQELTSRLGQPTFYNYVNRFDYGNRDVTGDEGKLNGLSHSWLMSSLEISADEQAGFVRKLLNGTLPVRNPESLARTREIIPVFETAQNWTVTGKTGSGFQRRADGTLDRSLGIGWFVGWASQGTRTVVFANVLVDEKPSNGYAGLRCREYFLQALPGVLPPPESTPKEK